MNNIGDQKMACTGKLSSTSPFDASTGCSMNKETDLLRKETKEIVTNIMSSEIEIEKYGAAAVSLESSKLRCVLPC
jgi:hypothetical protein